jgi:peptidoglycan/xylan/chitin deacetylase (PgdA/CDA1 family)
MTTSLTYPTTRELRRSIVDRRELRPRIPDELNSVSRFNAAIKTAAKRFALRSSIPFQRYFGQRVEGAFGILMYHRVTPIVPGLPTPTWNVTPDRFGRQLLGLLRLGFQPWPLREVLARAATGRPIPEKTFVVTFDDGYANNYHYAWPILRELSIPATIFLATAYLDDPRRFPFDDWTAAGSPRAPRESWIPLSTAQCCEMLEEGLIELGAHTHTHGDFRDEPDKLRRELLECQSVLRAKFGLSDATFAFPYGTKSLGFSGPHLAQAAADARMLCSLTTERELVRPGTSPFDWGRFTAEQADTAATLAVKLTGWFEQVRRLWRRVAGAGPQGSPGTLGHRGFASLQLGPPVGKECRR